MADPPRPETPSAEGTKSPKAKQPSNDAIWAAVQKKTAAILKKKADEQRAKSEEERKKEEEAGVIPTKLETKKEQQLTLGEVESWVQKGGRLKVSLDEDTIPYAIQTGVDGVGAQILLRGEVIGYIRADIGIQEEKPALGGALVGGVKTINVNQDYRGRGLGIVLAIAFYVRSQAEGATYVELSTTDTSGGWWNNLGMRETAIPIAEARGKVRGPKIRW
jgi:hypothetical protein